LRVFVAEIATSGRAELPEKAAEGYAVPMRTLLWQEIS